AGVVVGVDAVAVRAAWFPLVAVICVGGAKTGERGAFAIRRTHADTDLIDDRRAVRKIESDSTVVSDASVVREIEKRVVGHTCLRVAEKIVASRGNCRRRQNRGLKIREAAAVRTHKDIAVEALGRIAVVVYLDELVVRAVGTAEPELADHERATPDAGLTPGS